MFEIDGQIASDKDMQENGVWLVLVVFGYVFGLFLIIVIIWFIWYGLTLRQRNEYMRRTNMSMLNAPLASTQRLYDLSVQSSLRRSLERIPTPKTLTNHESKSETLPPQLQMQFQKNSDYSDSSDDLATTHSRSFVHSYHNRH